MIKRVSLSLIHPCMSWIKNFFKTFTSVINTLLGVVVGVHMQCQAAPTNQMQILTAKQKLENVAAEKVVQKLAKPLRTATVRSLQRTSDVAVQRRLTLCARFQYARLCLPNFVSYVTGAKLSSDNSKNI